jgi:hypothetical protein
MTAGEKKRMLGIVRTVSAFFSEHLDLKAGLTSHRIQTPVWQEECDKLMDDPEHSPEVHVKFQYLYNGLADAPSARGRPSVHFQETSWRTGPSRLTTPAARRTQF